MEATDEYGSRRIFSVPFRAFRGLFSDFLHSLLECAPKLSFPL